MKSRIRHLFAQSVGTRVASLALTLILVSCVTQPETAGSPAQLRVVTSGGLAAAYNLLAPEFEAKTGIDLVTAYGSSSGGAHDSIPMRLKRGEAIDVILLSQSSLNRLTDQGEVREASRQDIAHSKIGMAVRSGAPHPDITTKERFLAAIDNAESIGYSASASGTYLSTVLFPKLGIWEQIKAKSQRILSKRVASVVAEGEVEIGFQQVSEILSIEGADYVGLIPEEFQKTTVFSAGVTERAVNVRDAEVLIRYLSSAEAADIIRETGLSPVALLAED